MSSVLGSLLPCPVELDHPLPGVGQRRSNAPAVARCALHRPGAFGGGRERRPTAIRLHLNGVDYDLVDEPGGVASASRTMTDGMKTRREFYLQVRIPRANHADGESRGGVRLGCLRVGFGVAGLVGGTR